MITNYELIIHRGKRTCHAQETRKSVDAKHRILQHRKVCHTLHGHQKRHTSSNMPRVLFNTMDYEND